MFDGASRVVDAVFACAGAKPHQRPEMLHLNLQDFVIQWADPDAPPPPPPPPKRQQTVEEQWAIIESIQRAFDAGSVAA